MPQFPRKLIGGEGYPENVTRRIIQGVHHSKYVLVITKIGLYVAISTGNIARSNRCIDLTWSQFFPRKAKFGHYIKKNDFGNQLQSFLEHQSDQILVRHQEGEAFRVPSLMCWMKEVLGWNNLCNQFDFNEACVDLVATVPGNDPIPISFMEEEEIYRRAEVEGILKNTISKHCSVCIEKLGRLRKRLFHDYQGVSSVRTKYGTRCFSGNVDLDRDEIIAVHSELGELHRSSGIVYGAERLKECLGRRFHSIPSENLKREDEIIIQPTSIPGGISLSVLQYFLSCLKPQDSQHVDIFETLKILWPSCQTIAEIDRKRGGSYCAGGGLFMDDTSMHDLQSDGHARMHSYVPSSSAAFGDILQRAPPHNKTYARLINQDLRSHRATKTNILFSSSSPLSSSSSSSSSSSCPLSSSPLLSSDDCSEKCTCYDLAWFFLTSACLSRGALGDTCSKELCKRCGHILPGYFEYKNFELGVLFHTSVGKQYRALNPTCPIHQHTKTFRDGKVIVLPVPYDMEGGQKYFDNQRCTFRKDLSRPWLLCRNVSPSKNERRLRELWNLLSDSTSSCDDDVNVQRSITPKTSSFSESAHNSCRKRIRRFGLSNVNEDTGDDVTPQKVTLSLKGTVYRTGNSTQELHSRGNTNDSDLGTSHSPHSVLHSFFAF